MTDISLNENSGYMDIAWAENGDLETKDSLDTAILMSIFDEARADESEVAIPQLRRGWVGNETTEPFEQGSKQWLFEQERITGSTLIDLRDVIKSALNWMLEENIADNIIVDKPFLKLGVVCVNIRFTRGDSQPESRFYELWDRTGV